MTRTRRVIKIIGPRRVPVSLVCGVVATVLVAWWFQVLGWRYDFPEWSYGGDFEQGRQVLRGSVFGWGYTEWNPGTDDATFFVARQDYAERQGMDVPSPDESIEAPGVFGLPMRRMAAALEHEQGRHGARTGFRGSSDAYGFPFRCLRKWRHPKPTWIPRQNDDRVYGGSIRIAGPVFRQRDIDLSVSPYWPGLVGNALVYGLPLYAIASIPSTISGLRRRLTNRCHPCGYRLDGLTGDMCPECGWAIRRKAARPRRDGDA